MILEAINHNIDSSQGLGLEDVKVSFHGLINSNDLRFSIYIKLSHNYRMLMVMT